MFWNKKSILILVLLAAPFVLFANEHGEEKPAAAEGGHGGGAAPAEPKYSGRQTDEWQKVQTELTALKAKVEAQKATVEGLAAKSHGGHMSTEDSENLKKESENLSKMVDEYNALATNFQNRFPEKGAAIGRIYKRVDSDGNETTDTPITAEGRMRQLNKKIKAQYEKGGAEKEKPATAHAPANAEAHAPAHGDTHAVQPSSGHEKKKVHTVESTKKKKKATEEIPVTDQIILQK